MKRLLLFGLLALLATAAQAGVQARLSKTKVHLGEVVVLHITYDGQTDSNPATLGLSRHFKVLRTKKRTQLDFKDGEILARTVWDVRLKPRKTGRLRVPPVMVEGQQSRPLSLLVVGKAATRSTTRSKASAVTSSSKRTPPAKPKKPIVRAAPVQPKSVPPVIHQAPLEKSAVTGKPTPVPAVQPRAQSTETKQPANSVASASPSAIEATPAKPVVVESSDNKPVGDDDVFIETSVTPADPFVQQMVIFSVRIFHAVQLLEGELPDPVIDNALVRRLDLDRKDTVKRHGRRYKVIERRYAIFPQQRGKLVIPPPVLRAKSPDRTAAAALGQDASIFDKDPYFAQTPFGKMLAPKRQLTLTGEGREVEVRDPPAAAVAAGKEWLPAREVILTERFEPPDGKVKLGDPVVRVISLRVEGMMGEQLPPIDSGEANGANLYPGKPQVRTRENEFGVIGDTVQRFTYVPSAGGKLVIPSVQLSWWNTVTGQPEKITLAGRTFEVIGAPASKPAAPAQGGSKPVVREDEARIESVAQTPKTQPRHTTVPSSVTTSTAAPGGWLWPALAVLFGLLWLATVGFYLRQGKQQREQPDSAGDKRAVATGQTSARAARRKFEAACRANDARAARAALLAWAACHWPENPPRGLTHLARLIKSDAARKAINDLDAHLFQQPAGEWEGESLLEALKKLPVKPIRSPQQSGLPGLYHTDQPAR